MASEKKILQRKFHINTETSIDTKYFNINKELMQRVMTVEC